MDTSMDISMDISMGISMDTSMDISMDISMGISMDISMDMSMDICMDISMGIGSWSRFSFHLRYIVSGLHSHQASKVPWRELVCCHRFHEPCLLEWLKKVHQC